MIIPFNLGLPLGCGPLLILFGEFTLDPWDGNGCPNAGPEEGQNPTNLEELALNPWFGKG